MRIAAVMPAEDLGALVSMDLKFANGQRVMTSGELLSLSMDRELIEESRLLTARGGALTLLLKIRPVGPVITRRPNRKARR